MAATGLLTTSALARWVNLPESTVRDWENKGWISCERDSAGRRLFRAEAVNEALRLRARMEQRRSR